MMMAMTMTIEMKMTRERYQDPCPPKIPNCYVRAILHIWDVFFFTLEETLLLFCNRVCLLTAGDCLSPMLSALTNHLENIARREMKG